MERELYLQALAYTLLGGCMYALVVILFPWVGVPRNGMPLTFFLIGLFALLVCIARAGSRVRAALEASRETE